MMRKALSTNRRYRNGVIATALVIASFLSGYVVWASADDTCRPGWRLGAGAFDCASDATLSPHNDTRVNMLWLMRSLSGSTPREAPPANRTDPQFGRTFLTWAGLRSALWPAPTETAQGSTPAPSCDISAESVAAFNAALAAERGASTAERTSLGQLRGKVGCGEVAWKEVAIDSGVGREYLAYLKAAQIFHAGNWAEATRDFAALTHARSRWVAETAAYMPIRIGLRAAMAGTVDQYGDFTGLKSVNAVQVGKARDAIAAYLKAYPKGRYAASARGLTRRVAWLSGDTAGLAQSYEKLLATTSGDSVVAADLAEEIDNKLLERLDANVGVASLKGMPLLLAIADLKLMRKDDNASVGVTNTELEAQKAVFAAYGDLYGLIDATRGYYADEDPQSILTRLPDATRSKNYTPIAFSRQMLRGMALAKAKDPNAAGFWRALIAGASPFYQRPLAEMGLAIHWQQRRQIGEIFAEASPLADGMTREILLQTVATPDILRRSAGNGTRPPHERDVARFTLLYKDLTFGAFGDVGTDLALVPANANTSGTLWDFAMQDDIPVGVFRAGQWSDGSFACPPLAQTAAVLSRSADNRAAQLCLGEFYRLNGFDGFSLYQPESGQDVLGAGPNGFQGKAISRYDLYVAVIADRRARPDERAYALYRAVMCYAPSGYNGCVPSETREEETSGAEAPPATRQAWFTELKRRYPNSRWASSLRYYW